MSDDPLRRAWAGFLLARDLFDATRAAPVASPPPQRAASAPRPAGERPVPPLAPFPPIPPQAPVPPQAPFPPLPPVPTQRLFGIDIADLTRDEAVERIVAWAGRPPARIVITANLDHVMKLRHDELFQRVYRDADLVTADGMPFVWLSRREGQPLKDRVTGSDLILPLARAAAKAGRSLFLFGSTYARLHGAAKLLKREAPGLEIRGAYAPPFGFERDPELQREIAEIVRAARADIVLVALGAPKQEIWSHGMAGAVRKGVFVNIGGGLDFLSEEVRRAPRAIQRTGLEWAWRALAEPRRLGPRYLGIVGALPSLYRAHKADRAAHEAFERRRAFAAMSDARYRADRDAVRAREADEAAVAALEEPLAKGPMPKRDFER